MSKFLSTSGQLDLTGGVVPVFASTLGASSLAPSSTLKTSPASEIISAPLLINDISNLTTTLAAKLGDPAIFLDRPLPSNPPAGSHTLYTSSADQKLHYLNSAGVDVAISAAASGVSYTGGATVVGQLPTFSDTTGQVVTTSGTLESDLFLKSGSRALTGGLDAGDFKLSNVKKVIFNIDGVAVDADISWVGFSTSGIRSPGNGITQIVRTSSIVAQFGDTTILLNLPVTLGGNTLSSVGAISCTSVAATGIMTASQYRNTPGGTLSVGTSDAQPLTLSTNSAARLQISSVGVSNFQNNPVSGVSVLTTLAGTVAAPAVAVGAAGTGFYSPAASQLSAAVGGLERFRFTTGGVEILNTGTLNFNNGLFSNVGRGTFNTGSAAVPTLTFTGTINTGLYSPAPGTVSTSAGGVERLAVSAAGIDVKTSTLSNVATVTGDGLTLPESYAVANFPAVTAQSFTANVWKIITNGFVAPISAGFTVGAPTNLLTYTGARTRTFKISVGFNIGVTGGTPITADVSLSLNLAATPLANFGTTTLTNNNRTFQVTGEFMINLATNDSIRPLIRLDATRADVFWNSGTWINVVGVFN